ncbi:dihydrofolate reductase family protein [Agromyces sp. G08B096]|uniref:Dihydrofolate reductase family protein n=1 Tax=Agromyces sp. G08B096 TaxID=3156399 RepID=A0AAU7W6I7_9MICO
MRELVYYVAVSLDGYIAGPDGEFDGFLMEGDHMEAQNARFGDAVPTDAAAALGIDQSGGSFDTVLMGWNTYAVGLPMGATSPYRHLDQIVFTRSHLDDDLGERPNLVVTDEDPLAVVQRLKSEEGGAIWLCGGGQLATQLLGEIDRLVLKRQPMLFGSGIPLFAPGAYDPQRFDAVETTAYESGVVISEYVRRAG